MKARQKGYTLVEVMVVVAIIAMLTAIGVPSLLKARLTSQRNKCMGNARLLRQAITQYATEHDKGSDYVPLANASECIEYMKGNRLPLCSQDEEYSLSGTIDHLVVSCPVHGDFAQ
jgi:prepilin-type N-terminal cleavage/methylation domain-containing protein